MAARDTYHHGDLRAALVDASLQIVAEKGVAALSLSEAARRCGVSVSAPYRHFENREALYAATAAALAARLTAELESAYTGDALADLGEAARVLVRFGVRQGAGVDVIFAAELLGRGHQELITAGRALMDALYAPLLAVAPDHAAAQTLRRRIIAVTHGYASLLRTGWLGRGTRRVEAAADDAAETMRLLAR